MDFGIRAGCASEIRWDSGEWRITNIGLFAKKQTCGLAKGGEKPREVEFGELVCLLVEEAGRAGHNPLNLLLEAPLSVAFNDRGNPTPRRLDVQCSRNRYWYTNAGAVTLFTAGHLLRNVQDCGIRREVRKP